MSSVVKMTFDISIAQELDVNCAIILSNVQYWVFKNATNQQHRYEDRYWTYNSATAYAEQFKWLTEKQIRTCLLKLIETGYLIDGNHNANTWDRTKWYALTDKSAAGDLAICLCFEQGKCILPNGKIELPKWENRTSQMGNSNKEQIIITNNNPYTSQAGEINLASEWMLKNCQSLYDSARMKAPAHVKSQWKKVIDHFDAAVLKEELRYDSKVLYGRLIGLINNWKGFGQDADQFHAATRNLML